MDNDELIKKLEEFKDFLHVGNIFVDPFRWLGGVLIKGLALILDGLEKVTDQVLLIKTFFQNPEVVAFVDSIRPFLYILLAFSIIFTGYLMIFQKKFDREGIAINLFIALIILALLGTGMEKADEFTDDAIEAIGKQQLYGEEEGTISQNIFSRNIYDLTEFDKNEWSSTELERPNTIPLNMIGRINLTEKFDSGRKELDMTSAGKDLSKKQLIWAGDKKDTTKFDQSGIEWNNEYYYRFSVDWLTLVTTIIVMAFTLFSISYKLARLSFEMTFNYVLAIIVAPADIHDGQKTKKILQSILNTFLVIILIFLSMKIYMIGTAYLSDELDGMAYLIALIAFSVAVIDGPNIVERLFGIDAGLKSGWGVLAGAYAGTKMAVGLGKGLVNGASKLGGKNNGINKTSGSGSGDGNKPPSPNDDKPNDKNNKNNGKDDKDGKGKGGKEGKNLVDGVKTGKNDNENDSESGTDSDVETEQTGKGKGTGSVATMAEEQENQRKRSKAPSPNDVEEGMSNGSTTGSASASSSTTDGLKPTTAGDNKTTSSSGVGETTKVTDNATVRQDSEVTGVHDKVQGNTASTVRSGGNSPAMPTGDKPTTSGEGQQTTSSSNATQTTKVTDNSTVRTDTEVANNVNEVAGNTTSSTTRSGGGSNIVPTGDKVTGTDRQQTTSSSGGTSKNRVNNNSTVRTDTEVANNTRQVGGSTTTSSTRSGGAVNNPGSSKQTPSVERRRPRNYNINKGNGSIIDRMKQHRKK